MKIEYTECMIDRVSDNQDEVGSLKISYPRLGSVLNLVRTENRSSPSITLAGLMGKGAKCAEISASVASNSEVVLKYKALRPSAEYRRGKYHDFLNHP